jgi:hypothetical protein
MKLHTQPTWIACNSQMHPIVSGLVTNGTICFSEFESWLSRIALKFMVYSICAI